jgi:hypothetical protein
MNLETVLTQQVPHNYFYQEIKNQPHITIKEFSKFKTNSKFIVDTCVLINSINTFYQICEHLEGKNQNLDNIPYLVKCVYGQTKYLNILASQKKLITTEHIIDEFNRNLPQFQTQHKRLEDLTENSQIKGTQTHTDQKKISTHMLNLSQIILDTEFEDTTMIDNMVQEFKTTPSYVETLRFKSAGKKSISDEDVGLLMLGTYQKYINPDSEIYVVSGDKMLLAQGPVIFDNELCESPKILFSEYVKGFGSSFEHSFVQHKSPRFNPNKLNKSKKSFSN